MSYQVLARKYRPKAFAEMVGQEHVLRALVNALDNNRLHHAYLFTGTRGVGKTTLSRLLAKCLNCETGISSKPCGTCSTCQEIDAGRFVDLLEIDAASRTKVEDTRELLDNVQYAPSRGRYKVYLIDEVHMLSGHSFNALLKTLEEPPPHVKFLLATTDPQRLPVTVLSRCLQFNLKNLSADKIKNQLEKILQLENIAFEMPALAHLARAANGSMRDGLSLLDQAIAFSGGQINEADIRSMLGSIENTYLFQLMDALAKQDAKAIINTIAQLAEQGADFANVLEEFISLIHQMALAQFAPDMMSEHANEPEKIIALSQQFTAEDIQLFYQIGILGRRDLPLAPSARSGFEMVLLRMLAFHPVDLTGVATSSERVTQPTQTNASKPTTSQSPSAKPASQQSLPNSTDEWTQLIPQLQLSGFTQALAQNCILKSHVDGHLHLEVDPGQTALHTPKQEARLAEALTAYFGKPIKLQITLGDSQLSTPARNKQQQQTAQLQAATQALDSDLTMQTLIKTFDAKIQPGSIQAKNPAMLSDAKE